MRFLVPNLMLLSGQFPLANALAHPSFSASGKDEIRVEALVYAPSSLSAFFLLKEGRRASAGKEWRAGEGGNGTVGFSPRNGDNRADAMRAKEALKRRLAQIKIDDPRVRAFLQSRRRLDLVQIDQRPQIIRWFVTNNWEALSAERREYYLKQIGELENLLRILLEEFQKSVNALP